MKVQVERFSTETDEKDADLSVTFKFTGEDLQPVCHLRSTGTLSLKIKQVRKNRDFIAKLFWTLS